MNGTLLGLLQRLRREGTDTASDYCSWKGRNRHAPLPPSAIRPSSPCLASLHIAQATLCRLCAAMGGLLNGVALTYILSYRLYVAAVLTVRHPATGSARVPLECTDNHGRRCYHVLCASSVPPVVLPSVSYGHLSNTTTFHPQLVR